MTEPAPADSTWPRYSAHPFPPYRFIPGKNPHPRRDPGGHSYGKPEPTPSAFRHDEWHKSEEYLYGIDLYNFGFWWECHEVFEGLWHAAGRNTEQGNFFQALIQLAASNLKRFLGDHQAAQNLLNSGIVRLRKTPKFYMGIDVARLTEEFLRHGVDPDFCASPIRLHEQDLI